MHPFKFSHLPVSSASSTLTEADNNNLEIGTGTQTALRRERRSYAARKDTMTNEPTDWYNANDPAAVWDATEVVIETNEAIITLCVFIGRVAGPDGRWVYSLDVPDGTGHNIRALMPPGFADSREEAMSAVGQAITRLVGGIKMAA